MLYIDFRFSLSLSFFFLSLSGFFSFFGGFEMDELIVRWPMKYAEANAWILFDTHMHINQSNGIHVQYVRSSAFFNIYCFMHFTFLVRCIEKMYRATNQFESFRQRKRKEIRKN